MKIRKIDNERMRRHRGRHLPQYRTEQIDREDLLDIGVEAYDWVVKDIVERFKERMRARHAFDKKQYDLVVSTDFNIDHNLHRITVEQRFAPRPTPEALAVKVQAGDMSINTARRLMGYSEVPRHDMDGGS